MSARALRPLALAVAALLAPRLHALPQPPHSYQNGIGCGDCHVPYGGLQGALVEGQASAGSTTRLSDVSQSFEVDAWAGAVISFVDGANAGQFRELTGNSATELRWTSPLPAAVQANDSYSLGRSTEQDIAARCASCHNPTGSAAALSDIGLHEVGGRALGCGTCHEPHNVEPNSGQGRRLIRAQPRFGSVRASVAFAEPGQGLVAGAPGYNGVCEVCHTRAAYHRNDATGDHDHNVGADCLACHGHGTGFGRYDHEGEGKVVWSPGCQSCHGSPDPSPLSGPHGSACGLCHVEPLGGGPLVEPHESSHPAGGACAVCHGDVSGAHGSSGHAASAGQQGDVRIFLHADHEPWDPGDRWATVHCTNCHAADLTAVHAGRCASCHPTPRDTLAPWGRGCQQGGCHASYHAQSHTAHLAVDDQCNTCHDPTGGGGAVPEANCAFCHASPTAGPLLTSSDAQPSYSGIAHIEFSTTVPGGKIGVGITYHALDGAPAVTGSSLDVTTPGAHTLRFWSVDQSGRVETPVQQVSFSNSADTAPPVTTSNVQALYYQSGTITLTATDDSDLGVKATYYRLDSGALQQGTVFAVPRVVGTVAHSLQYWSEDFAGNVESPHTEGFTVVYGNGTFRLVWGNCDGVEPPAAPTPPPAGAEAAWTIYGGPGGTTVLSTGYRSMPGWSGVDDVSLPVSPYPFTVLVDWNDPGWYVEWDQTGFSGVSLTTPGQVVRLSY